MNPARPCVLLCLLLSLFSLPVLHAKPSTGVTVSYELPSGGSLPATYLVTLAITDPKNPDWIISTFVAGQPRTVTADNKGKFTETWDGLDENFMPVPPGSYGVKGIYSPASKWPVDGEWHAITPLFAGGFSPWLPSPETPQHWTLPLPFGGDPVNSPFQDVDVGPNGVAVFYYQYLENGKNNPLFDLNKPLGREQYLRAFSSGGAAGGSATATDGETVWSYAEEGGPRFVYRADQKAFGNGAGAYRKNVFLPEGLVTAMDAWKDPTAGKSYVYLAQRGKIITAPPAPNRQYGVNHESTDEFINEITVLDGNDATVLARMKLAGPRGISVQGGFLHALHSADGKTWTVSRVALQGGIPRGNWQVVFQVPVAITPRDIEIDASGRYYLSDSDANRVYQLNARGQILRTYGRLPVQKPGSYDPETLMAPAKLATWRDAAGKDRLIIVEAAGPNRVSEWSADTGKLLREFSTYQTKANSGYAVDPDDASIIYLPGQRDWLTRFKVDYTTREWKVDAVWPGVPAGQRKDLEKLVAVRVNGTLYLASECHLLIYRLSKASDRWFKSAGLISGANKQKFLWSDANGNGEVDEAELRPTTLPGRVLTYHGQRFLPDLSYLAPAEGGRDLWRLPVARFDEQGNPVFTEWQKVLTDPILEARAAGKADALHGGNETADTFSSDWMQADGSMQDGFYIQARGGKSFTANFGSQHKITRYVPDGKGGYSIKWRVGRTKLGAELNRGEIEGGMRLFRPINGILSVVDQSRSGLHLYTEDGLYIDSLFPPTSLNAEVGVYRQPAEFFAGTVYPNANNGKIYYGSGKYTPLLYEMQGWSLKNNPVRPLTSLTKQIDIKVAQISDALPLAVTLRGGVGQANIASFSPALGGVKLDGSLAGWESAKPVSYGAGKDQKVEARCLYDAEHLYIRWHVRLGNDFVAKPLPPLERIFTHDQESNTVSFYIQGDVNAPANGPALGRDGDARLVFGLFKEGDNLTPVVVGMHPFWKGKDAQPQIYRTPVGEAKFEHVDAVKGAKLGAQVDADGKGFVISAEIPRDALPAIQQPFSGAFRTLVNFSANLGGHNKFWWANTDGSANIETYDEPSEARLYPGSWAPVIFSGLENGYAIRNWRVLGPFGGPEAWKFSRDIKNKAEVVKFFEDAVYPPDTAMSDQTGTYEGELVQGYWANPGKVAWTPAMVDDLDTRVVLGGVAQVWYATTWIYAPEETSLSFELQGHRLTPLRWFLNGQKIDVPETDYTEDKKFFRTLATRPVKLNAGWNQVFVRGYNTGYAPFKVGVVLKAPEEKLWPLRFSGEPPR